MTPVRLLAALAGVLVVAALARALGWGVGGLLPLASGDRDWRGLALAAAGGPLALEAAVRIFADDA